MSTQLLVKIPAFKLNNRFVFHRVRAVDTQSMLEILRLIHDFLLGDNIVTSSVYILFAVFVREMTRGRMTNAVCFLLSAENRGGFDSVVAVGINVKHTNPIAHSINLV